MTRPLRLFARIPLAAALGAVAGVALPAGASSTDWPPVADPPRSHAEWVAQDARINGLPMRIEHFDSEVSVGEVIDFYERQWAGAPAGAAHRKHVGDWEVVSTISGPFEIAVQVRRGATGGSQGLVSVSNRRDARKDWLPRDWPQWPGTRVTEVTESADGGQRSQMVAMTSTDGYDITVQRWRDEWKRRGYALTRQAAPPAQDGTRSWVGLFDKPPYELDVAVTWNDREHKSHITANWLTPKQETP